MADNNVKQTAVSDTADGVNAKLTRKIKVGFIFLALVPVAVFLMVQTVAQMPFFILAAVDVYKGAVATTVSDPTDITMNLMGIFNERYALYSYFAYAILGIIVFGIWYYKGFVKTNPRVKLNRIFGVKSIIACFGMAIGFYFAINAVLILTGMLFPQVIENYNSTMESVGLGTDPVLTIVYAILLGPVIEEMVFRGVVFSFLEKAGIKPGIIIAITGILFGLVHVYPVQVVYAAALGTFLGFMRYKYRSILITIVAHMLLNLMGTYGEMALNQFDPSNGLLLIAGGVSLIVIVFVIVLINGDKNTFSTANAKKEDVS